jgi:hypothetical protein
METGTEILLARMKEYPEEFINIDNRAMGYDGPRWDRVLRDAREHLPKEDVDALDAGIKRLYVDRFNERVLKVLAGESEQEETVKYKASGRYSTGVTDTRGLFGNPVDSIDEEFRKQLGQYEAEQQRRMMDSQRRQMNSAQNTLGQGISSFKNFFGRAD